MLGTRIKSLFNWLISSGVTPSMEAMQAARIRNTNAIAVILCIIDVPNIAFFFLIGFPLAGWCLAGLMISYSLTLAWSRIYAGKIAKYWLNFIANASVALYADLFGQAAGVHFLFFPLLAGPFVMFSLDELPSIVFTIVASISMIVLTFMTYSGLIVTKWHLAFGGTPFSLNIVWVSMAINSYLMLFSFLAYNAVIIGRATDQLSGQAESLKIAHRKAESANNVKSNFLASMSHEIRTPLSIILGFSELLDEKESSQHSYKQLGEIIKVNSRHLLSLVNDILDLSKVESGYFEKSVGVIETVPFFNDLHSIFNHSAKRKQIAFSVLTNDLVPGHFLSDQTLLRRIFINIVGNAMKFTDHGHVTVDVSFRQDGDLTSILSVKISDSGCGIASHDFVKIFDPFTQASSFIARKYGGTGLGLGLSRKMACILGGDLVLLESHVDQGSVFLLTVDAGMTRSYDGISVAEFERLVVRENDAEFKSGLAMAASSRLRKIRILLVEDDPDIQLLIRIFLESEGAIVELAANGIECLELTARAGFDLVIMDIQMPMKCGYETVKDLRAGEFTKPILMISAHAMVDEIERLREAGCEFFISKPFTKEKLTQEIVKVLSLNIT